jgi:hypothetical protein
MVTFHGISMGFNHKHPQKPWFSWAFTHIWDKFWGVECEGDGMLAPQNRNFGHNSKKHDWTYLK